MFSTFRITGSIPGGIARVAKLKYENVSNSGEEQKRGAIIMSINSIDISFSTLQDNALLPTYADLHILARKAA